MSLRDQVVESGQGLFSVVLTITVSPYWYIRGGPQTALSGVGDPTERQASGRVLPMGWKGVVGLPGPIRLAGVLTT